LAAVVAVLEHPIPVVDYLVSFVLLRGTFKRRAGVSFKI